MMRGEFEPGLWGGKTRVNYKLGAWNIGAGGRDAIEKGMLTKRLEMGWLISNIWGSLPHASESLFRWKQFIISKSLHPLLPQT